MFSNRRTKNPHGNFAKQNYDLSPKNNNLLLLFYVTWFYHSCNKYLLHHFIPLICSTARDKKSTARSFSQGTYGYFVSDPLLEAEDVEEILLYFSNLKFCCEQDIKE